MRRLALLAVLAVVCAQPALAETLTVRLDQSARVRLSAPARDVVVGNPNVADVSMLDARNIVVLGKAYGVTNLLVVDRSGRTILDRDIVVGAPTASVSVYRGPVVSSYACAALCEKIGAPAEGAAAPVEASTPAP